MKYIALVIMLGGLAVAFFAGMSMIVLAFRKSLLWGLAYLVVPFAALVFLHRFWDEAKRPFFLGLKAWGVIAAGYGLLLVSVPSRASEATSVHDQTLATPPPVALRPAPPPTPMPTPLPTPTLAPPSLAPDLRGRELSASVLPGFSCLRVFFPNPFRDGRVIVHAHGVEVLNRTLFTPKGSPVSALDDRLSIPPGSTELKVWVISTDRTTNFYRALPTTLAEGTVHTLTLELQPAGLACELR